MSSSEIMIKYGEIDAEERLGRIVAELIRQNIRFRVLEDSGHYVIQSFGY